MAKKKNITLFGYIGQVCKELEEAGVVNSENSSPLATEEDVRNIVQEMVTGDFINSAVAESSVPTSEIVSGEFFVFCNGTPVVIKERTDGVEGCAVTWDGGEILTDSSIMTTVFGGRHDDETPTNSSITMEGGFVNYIIGGGLHKSHTVNSKIVMNGGTVKMVRSGAADQWIGDCSCDYRIFEGEMSESWCRVDNGVMELNGGHITSTVFGGGNGFARIANTSIHIKDGVVVDEYVFAGGANGVIEKASLVIDGGDIAVVAGCCRGEMDTIDIQINGGTIGKLFAGGGIPFAGTPEKPNGGDCHGKFNMSNVVITGGEITEISMGANQYTVIEEGSELAATVSIVDNRA